MELDKPQPIKVVIKQRKRVLDEIDIKTEPNMETSASTSSLKIAPKLELQKFFEPDLVKSEKQSSPVDKPKFQIEPLPTPPLNPMIPEIEESELPHKKRRVIANARERSRVHTISAAFEAVRHQIPAYTCNQKLSKLAILRIATSYIDALSAIVESDNKHHIQERINSCTKTLRNETKTKSRKNGGNTFVKNL